MKKLTLIIPAKNEKESLPKVLDELKKYECKILVVIDPEDIVTKNVIQNYDCKIIQHPEKGYGNALIEGIKSVDTEFLCIFNADGSFDPKYLSKMLELNSSNNDFVFASRYIKGGGSEDDTIITLIGNYIFTYLGKFFFNLFISDILFTYVMGKSNEFKKLELRTSNFGICVELPIKINFNKMKYTSIPSFERSRIAGKKKVNAIKDGSSILLKMINLYFKKILNVTK